MRGLSIKIVREVWLQTLLFGFALTGYCMYLLARSLGFERGVSLFAGVVLLAAPIHLSATHSHLSKIFLGLMPLVLLSLRHALNPDRSRWWAAVTAFILLLTILLASEQFIYSLLAMSFFLLAAWVKSDKVERMLTRGIRDAAPAHACHELCLIEPRLRVGIQSTVGIDTIVAAHPRIQLQDTECSGEAIAPSRPPRNRLGYDTVLTGPCEDVGGFHVGPETRLGQGARL